MGDSMKSEKAKQVESTVIHDYAYHPQAGLVLVFPRGAVYFYRGVPPQTFRAFESAASKGEAYNRLIKDKYESIRLHKP